MIETERLVLRPPEADDWRFVLDEIYTAEMMRYLGGKVLGQAQVVEGLQADIAAFAARSYFRWTMWLRAEQQRIGRIGLFVVRSPAAPEVLRGQREIGWMLASPYQGKGFASEAARAALRFGFETLADPVIFSQTSDSNAASTRMMARLGLNRCAELDYVDPDYPAADNPTTVYRMTRGEWRQQRERDRD
jgi:RimJ/RimL family protein N-acetyltransferase